MYDCDCNSGSPLREAVGSLEKELIRLWNSILPEPEQPSAQLPKLIRLTACKKIKHTVSHTEFFFSVELTFEVSLTQSCD